MPGQGAFKVLAIVGLAGSGKSEIAKWCERRGYRRIRFGEITDRELREHGLPLDEENERMMREELRRRWGMAAYARLSLPAIDEALSNSNVVVDGMYSWEEYTLMREHLRHNLVVLAVWSPPEIRYTRLAKRAVRPLPRSEAVSRDYAEIERLNKGGPIAMADRTILNDAGLGDLEEGLSRIIGDFERS